MPANTAIILEPYLEKASSGHPLNCALELVGALQDEGYLPTLVTATSFSPPDWPSSIPIVRLLPEPGFSPFKNQRPNIYRKIATIFSTIPKLYLSAVRIRKFILAQRPTLIIQATSFQRDLLRWLLIGRPTVPTFLFSYSLSLSKLEIKLLKQLLYVDRSKRRNFYLCVFDNDVVDRVKRAGLPTESIIFLPQPLPVRGILEFRRNFQSIRLERFAFAYAGDARTEKGFFLLPPVIESLRDQFFFTIQCNSPATGYDSMTTTALQELRKFDASNVQLISQSLSEEPYFRLLAQSNAIILPYLSEFYGNDRPSGILIEAWLLGKPVVVPENTWMAAQVHKWGGGTLFCSGDVVSLQNALLLLAENYDKYCKDIVDCYDHIINYAGGSRIVEILQNYLSEGHNATPQGIDQAMNRNLNQKGIQ